MGDRSTLTSTRKEFLSRLEQVLASGYAECFTEETKKVRNLVLVTGFVLILSSLGVLSLQEAEVPWLGMTVHVTKGVRGVLTALCFFFVLLLCARSYTEWHMWRLKHQAPTLELLEMNFDLASAYAEIAQQQNIVFERSMELVERIRQLPYEKGDAAIEDQLSKLKERHREVLKEYTTDLGPRTEQLHARLRVVLDQVRFVSRTLAIRFWFEAIFPVAFGALAILSAVIAP